MNKAPASETMHCDFIQGWVPNAERTYEAASSSRTYAPGSRDNASDMHSTVDLVRALWRMYLATRQAGSEVLASCNEDCEDPSYLSIPPLDKMTIGQSSTAVGFTDTSAGLVLQHGRRLRLVHVVCSGWPVARWWTSSGPSCASAFSLCSARVSG